VAQKRKTLNKRARAAIERLRGPHLIDLLRQDYSDENKRAFVANWVLTLSDRPEDAPLRRAFKEAKLNPLNPHHWRRLLNNFAEIHFPSPPAKWRGAPPKWDDHKRLLFQTHLAMARKRLKQITTRHGHRPPDDTLVAEYFQYKWSEFYQHISAATIRRYIASGPRPERGVRNNSALIITPLIHTTTARLGRYMTAIALKEYSQNATPSLLVQTDRRRTAV
jgi:hypothetical protein